MQSRQHLCALLSNLTNDVNQYLNKVNYHVISGQNKEAMSEKLGELKARHRKHYVIPDQNMTLFVYGEAFRNLELLAKRTYIMLALRDQLEMTMNQLKQKKEITENQLTSTILEVQGKIQSAIEGNSYLNSQFSKHHLTFQQNRLSGMNYFFSWWNKSAYQSRAMQALETAQSHLDTFIDKMQANFAFRNENY